MGSKKILKIVIAFVLSGVVYLTNSPLVALAKTSRISIEIESTNFSLNDIHCGFIPDGCVIDMWGKAHIRNLGTMKYTGSLHARWNESYPNGKGGYCAPSYGTYYFSNHHGKIKIETKGALCDSSISSETNPHKFRGKFVIVSGTGRYSKASGDGTVKSENEDGKITINASGKIRY